MLRTVNSDLLANSGRIPSVGRSLVFESFTIIGSFSPLFQQGTTNNPGRNMRFTPRAISIVAASLLAVAGCTKKSADNTPPGDSTATAGDSSAMSHDSASSAGPMEVKIVKGEPGQAFPDAKLTVVSPSASQVVTSDSVMVRVELKGVELASPTAGETDKGIAYSKEGQHIHVIIDDKPYMAMYKTDSFSVGALSPGVHTLRAFPSRSWHESIKSPGAFVAHNFYVKSKSGDVMMKEKDPMLTYSRPKGDYKGNDTKRILLDFYLSNAELGPDKYKVVASIDGQVKDTLTEWVPYFIEGLGKGEHKIKLELIGPDGKPVPGPYNITERTINVMPDQVAAAPAAGHSGM